MNDCWEWPFHRKKGVHSYGQFGHEKRTYMAHRVAYEMAHGEIPPGFEIDHLCRNPGCVNPNHLQAVPKKINIVRGVGPTAVNARKQFCVHGHEFTPENTYIRSGGNRACRACTNEIQRRYQQRKREAA